jgi:hypothetical protein
MPKVELTSAEWNWVLILLDENRGHLSDPILKAIDDQLDKQEN